MAIALVYTLQHFVLMIQLILHHCQHIQMLDRISSYTQELRLSQLPVYEDFRWDQGQPMLFPVRVVHDQHHSLGNWKLSLVRSLDYPAFTIFQVHLVLHASKQSRWRLKISGSSSIQMLEISFLTANDQWFLGLIHGFVLHQLTQAFFSWTLTRCHYSWLRSKAGLGHPWMYMLCMFQIRAFASMMHSLSQN